MKNRFAGFAAFLFLFFMCIIPVVAADIGPYVVKPVSPDNLSGAPHDPVPITFWNLGFRGMAIVIVLACAPILVFPVELFFTLKIFIYLGYWKIAQSALFNNRNRCAIYSAIRENPGITFNALCRLTGMAQGLMEYHLTLLNMRRKVVSMTTRSTTGYFENNGKLTAFEKIIFIHMREKTTQEILKILIADPDVSRKDIAERLVLTGPSITWHTNQLVRDGILTVKKNGVYVHYTFSEDAAAFFQIHRDIISERRTGVRSGYPAPTGTKKRS
jgi:predicted transcriptional regulator